MTDYTDIIRRLTEAAGPDRTLDWEVHVFHGLEGVGMYGAHPEYTASLDASIALCEMMLPGCSWNIEHLGPRDNDAAHVGYNAFIHDDKGEFGNFCAVPSCEPPFCAAPGIALCLAMFRALAQSKAGE